MGRKISGVLLPPARAREDETSSVMRTHWTVVAAVGGAVAALPSAAAALSTERATTSDETRGDPVRVQLRSADGHFLRVAADGAVGAAKSDVGFLRERAVWTPSLAAV